MSETVKGADGISVGRGATYPLLSVAVHYILNSSIVPVLAESEEGKWQKSVFGHDHEVGEEAGECLKDSDLEIGVQYESKNKELE